MRLYMSKEDTIKEIETLIKKLRSEEKEEFDIRIGKDVSLTIAPFKVAQKVSINHFNAGAVNFRYVENGFSVDILRLEDSGSFRGISTIVI